MWNLNTFDVYHGCSATSADAIVSPSQGLPHSIRLGASRLARDFGPAFYVTTILNHAVIWAEAKGRFVQEQGAVVRFSVNRDALAALEDLVFPSMHPSTGYPDYVALCQRDARPSRPRGGDYDCVIGPVSRFTTDPVADHNQIAFVTQRSLNVLQSPEIVWRG